MRKRILTALMATAMLLSVSSIAKADADAQLHSPVNSCIYMRATGYCEDGITKSGKRTRKGICAMSEEYLGATAFVYAVLPNGDVGELLGIYEVLDTGYGQYDSETGLGTIEAGKTIDIWFPSADEVYQFSAEHGDYVYVKIEWGCVG